MSSKSYVDLTEREPPFLSGTVQLLQKPLVPAIIFYHQTSSATEAALNNLCSVVVTLTSLLSESGKDMHHERLVIQETVSSSPLPAGIIH